MMFAAWSGKTSVRTRQYRMVVGGGLFDLLADPAQTRDLTTERPEVAKRLTEAAGAWQREVTGGRKPAQGRAVDPRPIPVGFTEFPITRLPARDGEPGGGVTRSASAPNSSYFVNWTNTAGRVVWNLDVRCSGDYEVVIDYTCPDADAGATIEVAFNGSRLTGKVAPGWDPPLYTNQDTIPRPAGESRMKEFRPLRLGVIRLEKGLGPMTLKALEVPGKSVMDVRSVTLTLLNGG
jgi:hypothetical protein